jgi:hypothetical protein
MSKYLIRDGIRGMFSVNDNNVDCADYVRTAIDWVYQVDDDGTLTYKSRKVDQEDYTIDVKKGNLVVQFYQEEGVKYPVVVLNDQKFIENVKGIQEVALARAIPKCASCEDCDNACISPAQAA